MPRSFAQSTNLTCPQCGHTISAEVWLIVDAGERPDLLARTRTSEVHDLPCIHCGTTATVNAPLLIYLPDPAQGQPPLIFSPAQQSSSEQTQQQGSALLGAAQSDDPAAAMRQMQAEMAAALDRLRTEDLVAYRQLEEAARRAGHLRVHYLRRTDGIDLITCRHPDAAIELAATLIAADDHAAKGMEASGAASPLAQILPFTDPPNFT